MIVRPIAHADLPSLLALAEGAGIGMTTLPRNQTLLAARIDASERTFAGRAENADRQWMFVLEDPSAKRIAGVSAIVGAVGLRDPFYSYRVGLVVHASRELGIFTQTPTLFLSNDHTGASELCSLYLDPQYRQGRNGALLSKCRFLFMAEFRDRFADKVFAELRGVSDTQGRSPFWESLGRHFFSMDFAQADYLTGIGKKSFVAELMPKHPLYTSFLTPEAQAAIGETHELTKPARRLLEEEGFRYDHHVDIFDAGPTVECALADIHAVRHSVTAQVSRIVDDDAEQLSTVPPTMVATTALPGFRLALGRARRDEAGVVLSRTIAEAIGAAVGERVRLVALSPRERSNTHG